MKTINSILIANRGEIVSRVIRTCRQMGIRTVAVYTDADQNHPYVREADIAVHIGDNAPALSYLDQDKIISVCREHQVDAIHPGYGFLSENADFAQLCQENGIIFVGPDPEAISALGSKAQAKGIMQQHDVPVIPGYNGTDQSIEKMKSSALEIGYPVLLKASAGGGGKGMRIVHDADQIEDALASVQREAKAAFGDDQIIIEKYIASGKHIEFQILGDSHGHLIHLLERECTVQRRFQKVIEESPSSALTPALREKMGAAAIRAAQAIKYHNAGTVEFILDNATKEFYFLEVNTRLQVEHPVTEEVTGVDLVKWQIEIAQGANLTLSQDDISANGYAMECRLYAEDPANDYLPMSGQVLRFELPEVEGVRLDSTIESGTEVSIYYDPMLAKIICHGVDKKVVCRKVHYLLSQMTCLGLTTNQKLLKAVIKHPDFISGDYDIHFIANKINLASAASDAAEHRALIATTLLQWQQRNQKRTLLASIPSGWRNNPYQGQQCHYEIGDTDHLITYQYGADQFSVSIADQEHTAQIKNIDQETISIVIDGVLRHYAYVEKGRDTYISDQDQGQIKVTTMDRFPVTGSDSEDQGYIAPMPSQVVQVLVSPGDTVAEGDTLVIISSMKMENRILAYEAGTVEEVYVSDGENIEAGTELIKMQS